MRRCDQILSPGSGWGGWQVRRHALFCADCRRASRADRKLRRGARAFRRALSQTPAPAGLEAQIGARLGLAPTRPVSQTPIRMAIRGDLHRSVPLRRAIVLGAVGLVAALFSLPLVHQERVSQRAARSAISTRAPGQSESAKTQLAGRPRPVGPGARLPNGMALSRPVSMAQPPSGGFPDGKRVAHDREAGSIGPLAAADAGQLPRRDDLDLLNGRPLQDERSSNSRLGEEWETIEARIRGSVPVRDEFITIPFPRLVSTSDRSIAQAAEEYKREAAIVDPRLSCEVTCAFKATALSDLCDQLRSVTGIWLTAGPSVADEKVTLFCEKLPLRDVMRQLSRPFGYTWLRGGKPGEYRYELIQDLKSQLLEEELRNRDRDAALLALEQEMSRYRRYLDLSPDEARARAASAPPEEKKRLENLASWGWGPIHMFFGLSPRELAILRAGQKLTFGTGGEQAEKLPGLVGGAGEEPLPSELKQGVLQSLRDQHVVTRDGGYESAPADAPGAIPLTAVPEAQPIVTLELHQSELGQYTLDGHSGFAIPNQDAGGKVSMSLFGQGPYASGWSPAVLQPNNRAANAKLAGDPTLRARVSFQPHPSCGAAPAAAAAREGGSGPAAVDRKVTTADVLEAIHQATGRPVVGDSYTHLYKPEVAAIRNQPLLDALNQVADTMHLRWSKDAGGGTAARSGPASRVPPGPRGEAGVWLQFRSSGYYNDRLKEVPNRLLARWAASRRQHGVLTLDDLLEIAQLPEAQLDATDMAEGARECWGLAEWNLSRGWFQRPHLRYLAQLTPAQRQQTQSASGLAFTRMSPAQQQQFISLRAQNIQSLEELAGATLRVGYTQPGGFQWAVPQETADLPGRGAIGLSPVHERTREGALQAARQIDPHVDPAQITPSELALTVVYTLGSPRTGVREFALQVVPAEVRTLGHHFPPPGGAESARAGS